MKHDPMRIVRRIGTIKRREAYRPLTPAEERAIARFWRAWHSEVAA